MFNPILATARSTHEVIDKAMANIWFSIFSLRYPPILTSDFACLFKAFGQISYVARSFLIRLPSIIMRPDLRKSRKYLAYFI
jgi:hypothetical protein